MTRVRTGTVVQAFNSHSRRFKPGMPVTETDALAPFAFADLVKGKNRFIDELTPAEEKRAEEKAAKSAAPKA